MRATQDNKHQYLTTNSTNQTRRRTCRTPGAASFPNTKLSSASLARLSYACALRRQVKLGVARHRLRIGGLILSLLSVLYGRRRYLAHRQLAAQVPALVDRVLDRLAAQKELAFESGADGESEDPFLFLPNLRDDVLRSMHSLADRERLWRRVRAVVEQNSNVRTGQREGRNGEVGRAWEWIGPSRLGGLGGAGAGEGGVASARRGRRSVIGRVSWGDSGSEAVDDGKIVGAEEKRRVVQHRKWEEARPIY